MGPRSTTNPFPQPDESFSGRLALWCDPQLPNGVVNIVFDKLKNTD